MFILLSPLTVFSFSVKCQGCQPHTSTNMENMTSPASNNKAPYRGVPSRPNSRVQWGGVGVGERTLNSTRNKAKHFRFSCQKVESTTNSKLRQFSGRYTDINLETGTYGSKSGDYRQKSGDQEIQFKIWRLPDYPG